MVKKGWRPAMRTKKRQYTAVDLFAGAGLFSSAFQEERFQITLAIEQNSIAANTYAMNVGDHVVVDDVRSVRPTGKCDVLISGPPCQGFSTLGKRNPNDPRNSLSMCVATWAEALNPKIVVVENVPAFLGSIHWDKLKKRLETLGYRTSTMVLNAVDYGLPQLRQRCFAFGSRIDLPTLPNPTQTKCMTVREAWSDLAAKPTGLNGHVAREPSPLALARMKVIPAGGDKRDVMRAAPDLVPKSWWKINDQATDVWGRMLWDEPCNTLRTCLLNASNTTALDQLTPAGRDFI